MSFAYLLAQQAKETGLSVYLEGHQQLVSIQHLCDNADDLHAAKQSQKAAVRMYSRLPQD